MGTWWSEHPDLESLARRGRREYTEELAAAERDTEQLRKRRRSLPDICFEWMSRGDLVTVAVADSQFEGELVAVVNDLVVVRTRTVDVGVNLDMVDFVRSNRRGAHAGTSGERSVSSFALCWDGSRSSNSRCGWSVLARYSTSPASSLHPRKIMSWLRTTAEPSGHYPAAGSRM